MQKLRAALVALKGQQWRDALRLLGAMPQQWVTPDVISFNAAISACEKGQQWGDALRLLGAMPLQRVTPNVISFDAAIWASNGKMRCGFWARCRSSR